MEELIAKGYDAQLGARPMQRMVERIVMTPLARFVLENAEINNATLELDYQEEVICRLLS